MWRQQFRQDRREVADTLLRSRCATIDHFLAANPDKREAVIPHMVKVLWRLEHSVAARTTPFDDDWLACLYHDYLFSSPEDFEHNQLVVISFNYDRLPRLLMATMMANRFGHPVGSSWEAVQQECTTRGGNTFRRFDHVYGNISIVPRANEQNKCLDCRFAEGDLAKASSGIVTMWQRDSRISVHLRKQWLSSLWDWAERIIFLGFGYHEENLQTLCLGEGTLARVASKKRFVGGTAYRATARQLGRLTEMAGTNFVLGSPDARCTDFLQEHLE